MSWWRKQSDGYYFLRHRVYLQTRNVNCTQRLSWRQKMLRYLPRDSTGLHSSGRWETHRRMRSKNTKGRFILTAIFLNQRGSGICTLSTLWLATRTEVRIQPGSKVFSPLARPRVRCRSLREETTCSDFRSGANTSDNTLYKQLLFSHFSARSR